MSCGPGCRPVDVEWLAATLACGLGSVESAADGRLCLPPGPAMAACAESAGLCVSGARGTRPLSPDGGRTVQWGAVVRPRRPLVAAGGRWCAGRRRCLGTGRDRGGRHLASGAGGPLHFHLEAPQLLRGAYPAHLLPPVSYAPEQR